MHSWPSDWFVLSCYPRGRRSTLLETQFPAGHKAKVGSKLHKSAEIQAAFMNLTRIFFFSFTSGIVACYSLADVSEHCDIDEQKRIILFLLSSSTSAANLSPQSGSLLRLPALQCYKPWSNSWMTFMSCQFLLICGAFRTHLFFHTDWGPRTFAEYSNNSHGWHMPVMWLGGGPAGRI